MELNLQVDELDSNLLSVEEIVSEIQNENTAFATTWGEIVGLVEDLVSDQDPQNEQDLEWDDFGVPWNSLTCMELNLQVDELDSNLLSVEEIVSEIQNENTAFATTWGEIVGLVEDLVSDQDPQNEQDLEWDDFGVPWNSLTCMELNLQVDELDSNLLSVEEIVSEIRNENTAFATTWGEIVGLVEDLVSDQDPQNELGLEWDDFGVLGD
uniref:Uncharacterized protein n=1 Tax=Eptatretus burgeri TaxID=7764 RepID=A0A8C4N908_EPTBU